MAFFSGVTDANKYTNPSPGLMEQEGMVLT